MKRAREVKTYYPLKKGGEWDAGWVNQNDTQIRISVLCIEENKSYLVYAQRYMGFEKLERRPFAEFSCEDCAKAFALDIVYNYRERAYCSKHKNYDLTLIKRYY